MERENRLIRKERERERERVISAMVEKKNAHPPPPPLLQILPFKCCRYLSDILETQNREKFTKVKQDS